MGGEVHRAILEKNNECDIHWFCICTFLLGDRYMLLVVLLACSIMSKINDALPESQKIEPSAINPMVVNTTPSNSFQFSGTIIDGWYIDEQNKLKVPIGEGTF